MGKNSEAVTLSPTVKTVREIIEERENSLSPHAQLSRATRGRKKLEEECPVRTVYQRDRDRILHSASFRKLKGKTNVFLSTTGEQFRTRLTHTLEVASVARTIAQALFLNADLAEAIALGHDLGHTPFGHAGEDVIKKIRPDFHHARQSVRVAEFFEKEGKGLNLTVEVLDGILKHTKGRKKISEFDGNGLYGKPLTLEGMIVQYSDWIAYINHDLDDALKMGLITDSDIPPVVTEILGARHSERLNTMVQDIVHMSARQMAHKESGGSDAPLLLLSMSDEVLEAIETLRDFLYKNIYTRPEVFGEENRSEEIIFLLIEYLTKNPDIIYNELPWYPREENTQQAVIDFICSLTDSAAIEFYDKIKSGRVSLV